MNNDKRNKHFSRGDRARVLVDLYAPMLNLGVGTEVKITKAATGAVSLRAGRRTIKFWMLRDAEGRPTLQKI